MFYLASFKKGVDASNWAITVTSYSWYPSGPMVYAHEPSLKLLRDRVARFIGRTDNLDCR